MFSPRLPLTLSMLSHRERGSQAGRGRDKDEDNIPNAVPVDTDLIKTGYLLKRPADQGSKWKRRFFCLSTNTLTYYKDHKHMLLAKGDMMFTSSTVVSTLEGKDLSHGFKITFPSMSIELWLLAETADEKAEWMAAIAACVLAQSQSMRGYLLKKKGVFIESWSKRFFVLHSDSITYHADHNRTAKIQGAVALTANTMLELGQNLTLGLLDIVTKEKQLVIRAESEEVRRNWEKAILTAVSKLQQTRTTDVMDARIGAVCGSEKFIRQGFLAVKKSARVADLWQEMYFVLTPHYLNQYEDQHSVEPFAKHRLTSGCSVFETNLKPHSFQLVTADKVLHVHSWSTDETSEWVRLIRETISSSPVNEEDPLMSAVLKIPDELYHVSYLEKKPLGVVFERSGEWSIVRLSNFEDTGIHKGSALYAINDQCIILRPYVETVRELSGWKAPLRLTFLKPPHKAGWLSKQSRTRRSLLKSWKVRYFVLSEGRLMYYNNADYHGTNAIGDIPLMGAFASLIPHTEIGQHFCFRLTSEAGNLVLQGLTIEDMLDWASLLFYAISIASGGGHLLDRERKRQQLLLKEESEKFRLADVKARVAQRLERTSAIDRRVLEANQTYEESKRARELAEIALLKLQQEVGPCPPPEELITLGALEDEVQIKREHEERMLQQQREILREAECERNEIEQLIEELEEGEIRMAQNEYLQDLEQASLQQKMQEQTQFQDELAEERILRMQEVMALEEDQDRRRSVIDEFRENVISVLEEDAGLHISRALESFDAKDDVADSSSPFCDDSMQTGEIVRTEPIRSSNLPLGRALTLPAPIDTRAMPTRLAIRQLPQLEMKHVSSHHMRHASADLVTRLRGKLSQAATRKVHAMFKVMSPTAAQLSPRSPKHRKNSPSVASSVEDLEPPSSRTSLNSVTMDEPVEVHTEATHLQPLSFDSIVVSETPPPLAAIRVRAVPLGADPRNRMSPDPASSLEALSRSSSSAQIVDLLNGRPYPGGHLAHVKPALSSSSSTFQIARARPTSRPSSEGDLLDLMGRISLDSMSSVSVERSAQHLDFDYEGGDERDRDRDEIRTALQAMASHSSVSANSGLDSRQSSEVVRETSFDDAAVASIVIQSLREFDVSRLSVDVSVPSRSILDTVRRRSSSHRSYQSPESPSSTTGTALVTAAALNVTQTHSHAPKSPPDIRSDKADFDAESMSVTFDDVSVAYESHSRSPSEAGDRADMESNDDGASEVVSEQCQVELDVQAHAPTRRPSRRRSSHNTTVKAEVRDDDSVEDERGGSGTHAKQSKLKSKGHRLNSQNTHTHPQAHSTQTHTARLAHRLSLVHLFNHNAKLSEDDADDADVSVVSANRETFGSIPVSEESEMSLKEAFQRGRRWQRTNDTIRTEAVRAGVDVGVGMGIAMGVGMGVEVGSNSRS